ncbi:hypothetical protein E2C01_049649 [Portunus trituberculatus]|uniref:Uncharacterized protein n=1 Tax=Portunus trituberculatus TaxID=210409 RepID=A0A5B7GE85_PORTR|nr:hypothetical protein [Portunus trituberculatus]
MDGRLTTKVILRLTSNWVNKEQGASPMPLQSLQRSPAPPFRSCLCYERSVLFSYILVHMRRRLHLGGE